MTYHLRMVASIQEKDELITSKISEKLLVLFGRDNEKWFIPTQATIGAIADDNNWTKQGGDDCDNTTPDNTHRYWGNTLAAVDIDVWKKRNGRRRIVRRTQKPSERMDSLYGFDGQLWRREQERYQRS